MILISQGNLGDLIIQSALLSRADGEGVSFAVPSNLVPAADELWPNSRIISLDTRRLDGRVLAEQRSNRYEMLQNEVNELRGRFPLESVIPLVLTDDLISDRIKNLYRAYFELFSKRKELHPFLDENDLSRPGRLFLSHLPKWEADTAGNEIILCPFGGIEIKGLSGGLCSAIEQEVRTKLGLKLRVLCSSLDSLNALPHRLKSTAEILPEQSLIRKAASVLSKARAAVVVDTAWYHLAVLSGVPTVSIPGPRSFAHYGYPSGAPNSVPPARTECLDCYSSEWCVVTKGSRCSAQPSLIDIIAYLDSLIGKQDYEPDFEKKLKDKLGQLCSSAFFLSALQLRKALGRNPLSDL